MESMSLENDALVQEGREQTLLLFRILNIYIYIIPGKCAFSMQYQICHYWASDNVAINTLSFLKCFFV